MKSYEDLQLDYYNALMMLEHISKCYGYLLEKYHIERSGGFNREQYQPIMETLH